MPLERPLIPLKNCIYTNIRMLKNFVSQFHRLIESLSLEGETYPKVASASPPPAKENVRRLLQRQPSGRKTRKASWLKLRLCMEKAAGGERRPEKASTP
jgi:hypothetical protein